VAIITRQDYLYKGTFEMFKVTGEYRMELASAKTKVLAFLGISMT
jgi:hypothetical protein